MKKLIYILLITLFTYSCNSPSYKYRIEGKRGMVFVEAYTDSIYGANEDCCWYYNSNGTIVVINKPYKIVYLNKLSK